MNIDHIINLSNENEYYKWDNITYTDIQIEDSKSVNILTPIDQCMSIIDTYRKQRKNILVHCVSGVSRSVSIVLSYLIYQGLTLKDAFSYVKQLRTKQYTLPNIGFFKQLMTYEKIQCGAQTMTISDYISMRNNV